MSERKTYLDVMRIIAIGLVIFNHCPGYFLYQFASGIIVWPYMIVTMITRINVPLFFMISGTLLLGKEESFFKVGKRVTRIIWAIVAFTCGLYFTTSVIDKTAFNLPTLLRGILAGGLPMTDSYWYLYAYLGMLIMLPFLRKICKDMKKIEFVILITVHFVFSSILPSINFLSSICGLEGVALSGDFSIPLATLKCMFYPIIGFYIDRNVNIESIKRKHMVWLIVLATIGVLLSCILTYYEGVFFWYTENYVQLFDYLTAIVAFIIIKKICFLLPIHRYKAISLIGSLTFGIYLLDPYIKCIVYQRLSEWLEIWLPTIVVSVCWCLFSMFIGGMVTLVLRQVPGLKKIL